MLAEVHDLDFESGGVRERSVYHRAEDVIGCKWSAGVIAALAEATTG